MSTSIPVRSNGQVIDQAWFNTPRSEISTLDDRVDVLANRNVILFNCEGQYSAVPSTLRFVMIPVTKSCVVASVVLQCIKSGAAGSTKVDLMVKRGASSWTSVLTTAPIVPASAGDLADSATGTGATAGVVNATYQQLVPGDLLGLELEQAQTTIADTFKFLVYVNITGATE